MIYTSRMGRTPLNRERINITLPEGMPQALIDSAKALGRDRSAVIEELCRGWLKKNPPPVSKGGKR